MNYLEEYYNNYDEEGRLLSKHGQVEYHFTICERQDLIGASHHTLDILQKEIVG